MGFLVNTTNNIIVDAVLTDEGRARLARNDGSFRVSMFSLSDDEIDYTIIKEFGLVVGSEKIEKLTPIFEALTQATAGCQHKLVSAATPTLTKLPSLSLVAPALTSGAVSMTRYGSGAVVAVKVSQVISGGSTITAPLQDNHWTVMMDDRILTAVSYVPETVDSSGMATYSMAATGGSSFTPGAMAVGFKIGVNSLSDSVFDSFRVAGRTFIERWVHISGTSSGQSLSVVVRISPS